MDDTPLRIGIVAGEESGQRLAVDLVDAIAERAGAKPDLVGVGGIGLGQRGLKSIFDPDEIAITGISSVAATLPRLLLRIRQTANAFITAKPDAIILIDSPDFSHRVAKRVRHALPRTPIVKYVAPTVWAWRPGRARDMAAYIDKVLAILPFEPAVMARLGGPETHYIGHPLSVNASLYDVWNARRKRERGNDGEFDLLMLPGSRRSELKALLPDFRETVAILCERGHTFRIHMPTLPSLEAILREKTHDWPVSPLVTTGETEKLEAYRVADAALAASGTVLLELALAGVPAISCYRTDMLFRSALGLVTAWSAALPNVIADRPLIPEYIDHSIRPGMLARRVEDLVDEEGTAADVQMQGFEMVRELMRIDSPPGDKAAGIILDAIASSRK